MLIAYWDKTLGKVYTLNIDKKDKKATKVIDKIVKIPAKRSGVCSFRIA